MDRAEGRLSSGHQGRVTWWGPSGSGESPAPSQGRVLGNSQPSEVWGLPHSLALPPLPWGLISPHPPFLTARRPPGPEPWTRGRGAAEPSCSATAGPSSGSLRGQEARALPCPAEPTSQQGNVSVPGPPQASAGDIISSDTCLIPRPVSDRRKGGRCWASLCCREGNRPARGSLGPAWVPRGCGGDTAGPRLGPLGRAVEQPGSREPGQGLCGHGTAATPPTRPQRPGRGSRGVLAPGRGRQQDPVPGRGWPPHSSSDPQAELPWGGPRLFAGAWAEQTRGRRTEP